MNLLQLANQLRIECGTSANALTTAQSLTGEQARLVSWIQQAWREIQLLHEDWNFLRQDIEFNCIGSQRFYTPGTAPLDTVTNLGHWKKDSWRCSSVGASYADEQRLTWWPYNQFRDLYMYGNQRNIITRPVVITFDQTQRIGLGSMPDQAYVITGEYYTGPVDLTADTDSPACPQQFHMVVVYGAMIKYGLYENAPEVVARGREEYRRMMNRLEVNQLPGITWAPPLA